MTCEEFDDLMTAYLEGELPPEKHLIFGQHIESCRRCQEEMSSYENCTRIFRRFVADENPPDALRKAVFERCHCERPSDCCPPPKNHD